MIVNVGRIIKRPREWDGSIRISNIPVGTECFPEVFGQTAAVIDHSTKLFHLQREQAVTAPEGATSRGFFAVSSALTIFYVITIFLCYLLGHGFSLRFLNMQQ